MGRPARPGRRIHLSRKTCTTRARTSLFLILWVPVRPTNRTGSPQHHGPRREDTAHSPIHRLRRIDAFQRVLFWGKDRRRVFCCERPYPRQRDTPTKERGRHSVVFGSPQDECTSMGALTRQVVGTQGFEPWTPTASRWCSPPELRAYATQFSLARMSVPCQPVFRAPA